MKIPPAVMACYRAPKATVKFDYQVLNQRLMEYF
jgi:hypothetical protein